MLQEIQEFSMGKMFFLGITTRLSFSSYLRFDRRMIFSVCFRGYWGGGGERAGYYWLDFDTQHSYWNSNGDVLNSELLA